MSKDFLVIFLALFLVSSCGMKSDLDDMHDSTLGMEHTTKDMNETTKDMSETTKEMNETTKGLEKLTEGMSYTTDELSEMTAALLPLARTGGTATIRNERTDAMNNPLYSLNIENKILHAGIYWQSFEFQSWTSTVVDDSYTKMNFYSDAVEEFSLTLDSNTSAASIDVSNTRSINPATKNNESLNIFAFAVGAHKVLMYQEFLERKIPTFKKVSFLDIIYNALEKEKAYNSNKIDEDKLHRYEHLVLRNSKKLKYLLHARYSMLTTIALARINSIDQAGFFKKAKYYLKSWNANLKSKTRAEQEEIIEYLEMANDTKQFLEKIGEKVYLNKKINKIITKMRISSRASKSCLKSCVSNISQIKTLFSEVKN